MGGIQMAGSNGTGFEQYWAGVDEEVFAMGVSPVESEALPMPSSDQYTVYGVRFRGVGDYPLFAYVSVPSGRGPFPALFQAPGYGSVVGVPSYERRRRYVVLALCHRGQRHSDTEYQAAYPGLLTDGIDDAGSYRWRGIAADCLRGVDVLLDRPEVDPDRTSAVGGDLALMVTALRPQIRTTLVTGALLFRAAAARFEARTNYPFEEFNDYLRSHPERRGAVEETLALYDPMAFAGRVEGEALISSPGSDEIPSRALASALGARAELRVATGQGYVDRNAEEQWLWRHSSGD